MIRSWFAFVVAAVTFSAFAANTWYVDDDNYGKTGLDGASEATAFGTIQDAIDAATTQNGDTILVLPGTYDKGYYGPENRLSNMGDLRVNARVAIHKNNLTIKSTGGRDVTHIVGASDPEAPANYYGAWTNSVACVMTLGACEDLVFQGFTLRDGKSSRPGNGENTSYNNGGGFGRGYGECGGYSTLPLTRRTHVIDCAISNCVGRLGVNNSCTLHRCLVTHNRAIGNKGGSGGSGAGFGYAAAENSLFIENWGGNTVFAGRIVNCVVVDSSSYGSERISAYNSVRSGNWSDRDSAHTHAWTCFTNCVSSGRGSADPTFYGPSDNSVFNAAYTNLFVSSVLHDFRPISSSALVGRGEPKYLLSEAALPEGYDYKDFYGKPIDMTAETINAGISQETVTPQGGCAFWAKGADNTADMFKVNGKELYFPTYRTAYSWSTNALEQVCVTGTQTEEHPLSCVADAENTQSLANATPHLATRDGKVYVTLPTAGKAKTLTVECAMKIFYVDPVNGSDTFDGSCAWAAADPAAKKGPWRTLMYAATNDAVWVAQRLLIRCAPGRYAEGEDRVDGRNARVSIVNPNSKPSHRLHFVATGSAAETVIVGAPDPDLSYEIPGLGPNALRCVMSGMSGTGFTGFTLSDGYTTSENKWPWYGGACFFAGQPSALSDSIVENSSCREGVVYANGKDAAYVTRCLIRNNYGRFITGGGNMGLCGCVFKDNVATSDHGWFYEKTLLNCTAYVTNPKSGDRVFCDTTENYAYNSIFVNVNNFKGKASLGDPVRGSVLENCSGTLAGVAKDCVRGAAFLARPADDDYRPAPASPAWTATGSDFDDLAQYADTDYEGRPLIANGKVVAAGAVVALAEGCFVYVDNENGVLSVSGIPAGSSEIREGETLTLSVNASALRPVVGCVVDGDTNLFTSVETSFSVSYDEVVAAGGALSIQPIATCDWYVNPNTDPAKGIVGDDANHGYSPEFPKRTLAAVAAVATVSNDVIHAAAGVYDDGTRNRWVPEQPARVELDGGVTLVATEGREKTIIRGAAGSDENGLGAGAVRCVYLRPGATVRGFTITDGHVVSTNLETTAVSCGAGVAAHSYDKHDVYCEDCIISNCVCNRAVLYAGTYRNCELVNCTALQGVLAREVDAYNMLVSGNVIGGPENCVFQYGHFEGITYLPNQKNLAGEITRFSFANGGFDYCNNSLIMGAHFAGYPATNTVITVGSLREKFVNCRLISEDQLGLDANYRPIPGVSPLVDAGFAPGCVADHADSWGARDASGLPRVSNGTIDIGAFEADWRPVYTRDICRGMTVAEASPVVTESPSKGVLLGANGRVVIALKTPTTDKVPLLFTFRVDGTGTLTATWGDGLSQAFTAAAEEQTLQIRGAGVTRVTFAYTPGEDDTASAELLKGAYKNGLVVFFR